jgi:Flp pilus assembly protein TadG
MLSSLLIAGLAVDVGRGYLLKAQLSRAVDAAALAAARSLREGRSTAQARAVAVAAANGVQAGVHRATFSLSFGTNEAEEETVSVTASQPTPTLLMRLVGHEEMAVQSAAVAAIPPVDLVLVLDQSGSLGQAYAWDDLQEAAKQFVGHFDEEIDQIGLVSFNLRAKSHFELTQPFYSQAISAINSMVSVSYTNTGEGLRLAHQQFQGGSVRDRSAKVVVFFTDGRPTAFRGNIAERDRVMAAWTGNIVAGYWNDPETLPMNRQPTPDGCRVVRSCYGYYRDDVFRIATGNGAYWANEIREQGILVYTIGLGDTSRPPGHILQPDQDYLRELANEGGITDPDQPKGRMYFAPSAGEIRTVFKLVAQDLLARLTH